MSNNQTQKKQVQFPKGSLYETAANVDPITVGYKLFGKDIETFTTEWFKLAGVQGVEAARLQVVSSGSTNPRLTLHVFINKQSQDIISNNVKQQNPGQVNPLFLNNMNTGGMHASKTLKDAFTGVMLPEGKTKVHNTGKHFVYIPIDPIKMIGAMLAARHNAHFINITSIDQFKGQTIVTVFKTQVNTGINPNSDRDQYTAVLNNNNRRR